MGEAYDQIRAKTWLVTAPGCDMRAGQVQLTLDSDVVPGGWQDVALSQQEQAEVRSVQGCEHCRLLAQQIQRVTGYRFVLFK